MARGWTVAAAVLAILHAGLSFLGSMGMAMTGDHAEPMTTGEASAVAVLIALMSVWVFAAAVVMLAAGYRWPVLAAAGLSLVISGYVLLRFWGDADAYVLPLGYAVLPLVVVAILGTGMARRPAAVTA